MEQLGSIANNTLVCHFRETMMLVAYKGHVTELWIR